MPPLSHLVQSAQAKLQNREAREAAEHVDVGCAQRKPEEGGAGSVDGMSVWGDLSAKEAAECVGVLQAPAHPRIALGEGRASEGMHILVWG